jgi:glucose-6-phosphate dehydrogenase assembly protein OpcA
VASDVIAVERLRSAATGIDPDRIEREFERVWREAGGGGNAATMRLRVLNLVAIGTGADVEERFQAAMDVVPLQHPCRAILVRVTPEPREIQASIGARCWRVDGAARHLCSEEITISGSPARAAALVSAALPVLVPDLPVALWLMDAGAPPDLVGELADDADRMLFDSGRLHADVGVVELRPRFGDDGVPAYDVAWERSLACRELTAQEFDGADGVASLAELRRVELSGRPAESLLYLGWIASRLGWSLADVERGGGGIGASYYAGTRAVRARISPSAAEGIDRIVLDARTTLIIERHPASGHVHVVTRSGDDEERRVVEDEPRSEGELLAALLDVDGVDNAYQQAAEAAIPLAE